MPEKMIGAASGNSEKKTGRTAGWYVLLLAWLVFAAAFFLVSERIDTTASDITNGRLLDIARKYASYFGAAFGLVTFLATGILYLILKLFRLKAMRPIAFLLTLLAYGVWLVFGYDLVYLEPRYTELARGIITYLGKPMLYSAALVCGLAFVGFLLSLIPRPAKK